MSLKAKIGYIIPNNKALIHQMFFLILKHLYLVLEHVAVVSDPLIRVHSTRSGRHAHQGQWRRNGRILLRRTLCIYRTSGNMECVLVPIWLLLLPLASAHSLCWCYLEAKQTNGFLIDCYNCSWLQGLHAEWTEVTGNKFTGSTSCQHSHIRPE